MSLLIKGGICRDTEFASLSTGCGQCFTLTVTSLWSSFLFVSPQNDQSTEELHFIGSQDLSFLRGKVCLKAVPAAFREPMI